MMKKFYKKLSEKNENYDDLLGMTINENRFMIWSLRILFLFVAAIILLLVRNLI